MYSLFGASLTLLTISILSNLQVHNKLQFRMSETFSTLNPNRKRKKPLRMHVVGVMRPVYPIFALLLI